MLSDFSSCYFCLFLGSLFDHCLTNVWTTFGCLFGCLLGAFSGLLRFSWKPLDPKTLKNYRFLRFLRMQLFGSLKLRMALLGSSCPLFGRSGPKMGPKMIPKNAQKRNQRKSIFFFFDFLQNHINANSEPYLSHF